jgi:hypothetical protein
MIAIVLFVASLLGMQAPAQKPALTSVTGKWNVTLEMQAGTASPTLDLTQQGEKLTGVYEGRYGKFPLTGTVKAGKIDFTFKMNAEGTDVVMNYTGAVAADFLTMKGVAQLDQMGEANWTAKRAEK